MTASVLHFHLKPFLHPGPEPKALSAKHVPNSWANSGAPQVLSTEAFQTLYSPKPAFRDLCERQDDQLQYVQQDENHLSSSRNLTAEALNPNPSCLRSWAEIRKDVLNFRELWIPAGFGFKDGVAPGSPPCHALHCVTQGSCCFAVGVARLRLATLTC